MTEISGFEIFEKIYESSNSQVFRARRGKDGLPVVLKALNAQYPTPGQIRRYRQEYRITAGLNGVSGVIDVYDLVRFQNTLVIVLEDFGANSLDLLLESTGFSPTEFSSVALRTAEILAEIHAANVIHKDINPSNILLNRTTGQLKIIDFGISTELSQEDPPMENPNALEGTLLYISPEQTGRMNRFIDYRCDYYSLGATYYELLTGRPPFKANDALELVHSHIAQLPLPPCELNPAVPIPLSRLIMKLLAKDAEDRYQSSAGIRFDLEHCLSQYESSGKNEPIVLASRDVPERLQIPQKLYGREREIESLEQAFEQVSRGGKEMMLISGPAGIGKTSIVNETYKPVTHRKGYFVSGKFDQFQRDVPYAAFVAAFRDLIGQILTESEERLEQWRERLQSSLGLNGQIIIDMIPEVKLIVGTQPDVPTVGPMETRNRFNLVFQNFIRAFCQPDHPLVLFVDDLQWADSASLKLLELIMADRRIHFLFLIGSYRDTEVETSHPLRLLIDNLQQRGVSVGQVVVGALSQDRVTDLIAETLHADRASVKPLAGLVGRKTGANPFFLNQFTKSLCRDKLLAFDSSEATWRWDLDQIRDRNITDNVAELMATKIGNLRFDSRRAVEMAACVGSRFELEILANVCDTSPLETAGFLKEAVKEGFVIPFGNTYVSTESDGLEFTQDLRAVYKFSHDRVRQAAYSLIPESQKPSVHWLIGQTLLKDTPRLLRHQRIFDIVNHLNQGLISVEEDPKHHNLPELNLEAGKKAKASVAFSSAFGYFRTGLEMLDENSWDEQYDLTLDLHVEAVQTAYLTSNWDEMERLVSVVMEHATTLLDRAKVLEIKIQAYYAQHRLLDAVNQGLEILRLLGIRFPTNPTGLNLVTSLAQTWLTLIGKGTEDLVNLPQMSDPVKLRIASILTSLGPATYYAAPELLPLFILQGVRLSVRHGNAPQSPFLYSGYGLILSGGVGHIDSGYRFGELATALQDRRNPDQMSHRTTFSVNYFIKHWKKPLRETLGSFLDVYRAALEMGDFEYAVLALYTHSLLSYCVGCELEQVERYVSACTQIASELHQDALLHFSLRTHQVVLNLRGEAENPCRLKGASYDVDEMLPLHRNSHEISSQFATYFHQLILCCLFHEYEGALENANEAKKLVKRVVSHPTASVFYLYDSLARLALYPSSGKGKQRRILSVVNANQTKMKQWARHGPTNYLHKYYLVEAERLRVLGKKTEAAEHYDLAIAKAGESGFLNEEALATELAARFYLGENRANIARTYIEDARYCYQRWGAEAKIKDLEERYDGFPRRRGKSTEALAKTTSARDRTGSIKGEGLDLDSIVKASQTISGEIVLERLLAKLIRIIMENAGAQSGFLILESDGKLLIEARAAINPAEVEVMQSLPIEASKALSPAIVYYVHRTGEDVVLDDAAKQGRFTDDPHVFDTGAKSILCAPIIHQGRLTGIVYLENNLTPGAFTPDNLRVLKLLCSQAAISIAQARLYEGLEQRVEQRTADLLEANELLKSEIGERKRAEQELSEALHTTKLLRTRAESASQSKSTFVANMSHEIRTPLNAIMGMTDLALRTGLSPKLRDYLTKIRTSSHSLLRIVNDILDFSKIEAGKLDIEFVGFDVRTVMSNVSDVVSANEACHDIEFLVSTDPDVPFGLVGDPLRLEQVLTNLANNAVKFTHIGEVVIRVELVEEHPTKAKIRFSVIDTGIGIPEERIATLFEPFVQADGSTTRRYGGSGLGLTICQRLVNMMGGAILVKSELGKGSVFSFQLEFDVLPADERDRLTMPADLHGMRVLVVDDNETSQEILVKLLASFQFNPVAVGSGEEALDELIAAQSRKPYELVVLDWKMSGIDGMETARRIDREDRLSGRIPKIIMVTAFDTEEVRRQAKDVGLEGFLCKPVQPSILFDAIMDVFGKSNPKVSQNARAKQRKASKADNLVGARILVVEDNEINQQVAREVLEIAGVEVQTAWNGKAAVEALKRDVFDAVLMDIQMPEMDGYETTGVIRSDDRFKDLPIIAMTAHAMAGDREKCLKAGMNDHIAKPIDSDDLLAVVGPWIRPGAVETQGRRVKSAAKPSDREIELPDTFSSIDVQLALRRLGGNRRLLKKLLKTFATNNGDTVRQIRQALDADDIGKAQQKVHALKGASGSISAVDLHVAATNLDRALKKNEREAQHLLAEVQESLDLLIREVNSLDFPGGRDKWKEIQIPEDSSIRSIERVTPPMKELQRMLETYNPNAVDLFYTLKPQLDLAASDEDVVELERLVGTYQFREALGVLNGIARQLGISLN